MIESMLNGDLFGNGYNSVPGRSSESSGMQNAAAGSQNPAPIPFPSAPSGGYSLSAAERFSQADSFSLDLTTREGDRVTISFDHASVYQASLGATADGKGGSAAVFDISRAEQNQFQFQVQGDLSTEELDAIQNMIKDVSLIADDFFEGDVQAAFERASEYQMDRSQLASMELHMSRSEQYSAVSAYEQVQQFDEQALSGQRLGHMMDMMNQQRQEPALSFIDQLSSLQAQIVDNLVQQDSRYQDADKEGRNQYDENRNTLYSLLER
ncbi:MAG: hypothetical protein ACPGF7_07755 [Pontibacterium sp.]